MLIVNDCLMWTPLLMRGSSPDTLRPERAQPSIFLGGNPAGRRGKSLRLNCWGECYQTPSIIWWRDVVLNNRRVQGLERLR